MIFLLYLLYLLILYGAIMAGVLHIGFDGHGLRPVEIINDVFGSPPWATLTLFLAIGIPTVLQFFYPSILALLRRDTIAFLSGDWWRVITPLFVQDGGLGGSIFNLVGLLFVGAVAEHLWGGPRLLFIFFIAGIASEFVALVWQPVGAGNSVADFALAAGICILCLARNPFRLERLFAYSVLGAAICLLALHDIHGAATALGGIISLVLILLDRRISTQPG